MNEQLEILSDGELTRYSRQISIKAMDIDGQERLKLARVLMIGAGGLGCAAGQYLTVAGIGELTQVDFDTVELSNGSAVAASDALSANLRSSRPSRALTDSILTLNPIPSMRYWMTGEIDVGRQPQYRGGLHR